ncbi:hypothetical protein FO519_009067, partial [Halicephalobus sp. NKZ332]
NATIQVVEISKVEKYSITYINFHTSDKLQGTAYCAGTYNLKAKRGYYIQLKNVKVGSKKGHKNELKYDLILTGRSEATVIHTGDLKANIRIYPQGEGDSDDLRSLNSDGSKRESSYASSVTSKNSNSSKNPAVIGTLVEDFKIIQLEDLNNKPMDYHKSIIRTDKGEEISIVVNMKVKLPELLQKGDRISFHGVNREFYQEKVKMIDNKNQIYYEGDLIEDQENLPDPIFKPEKETKQKVIKKDEFLKKIEVDLVDDKPMKAYEKVEIPQERNQKPENKEYKLPDPQPQRNLISQPTPERPIIVSNLHPDVTERQLSDKFSTVGPLKSADIFKDKATKRSLGKARIIFNNQSDAEKALKEMNGELINNQPVYLSCEINNHNVDDTFDTIVEMMDFVRIVEHNRTDINFLTNDGFHGIAWCTGIYDFKIEDGIVHLKNVKMSHNRSPENQLKYDLILTEESEAIVIQTGDIKANIKIYPQEKRNFDDLRSLNSDESKAKNNFASKYPNSSKNSAVIGTLIEDFKVIQSEDQNKKIVDYYKSVVRTDKEEEISIIVNMKVQLPKLLRKGYRISVHGTERILDNVRTKIINNKNEIYYEGKTIDNQKSQDSVLQLKQEKSEHKEVPKILEKEFNPPPEAGKDEELYRKIETPQERKLNSENKEEKLSDPQSQSPSSPHTPLKTEESNRSIHPAKSLTVSNLHSDVTEDELLKVFSEIGPVLSINMIYEQGTKRFRGKQPLVVAENIISNVKNVDFHSTNKKDMNGNYEPLLLADLIWNDSLKKRVVFKDPSIGPVIRWVLFSVKRVEIFTDDSLLTYAADLLLKNPNFTELEVCEYNSSIAKMLLESRKFDYIKMEYDPIKNLKDVRIDTKKLEFSEVSLKGILEAESIKATTLVAESSYSECDKCLLTMNKIGSGFQSLEELNLYNKGGLIIRFEEILEFLEFLNTKLVNLKLVTLDYKECDIGLRYCSEKKEFNWSPTRLRNLMEQEQNFAAYNGKIKTELNHHFYIETYFCPDDTVERYCEELKEELQVEYSSRIENGKNYYYFKKSHKISETFVFSTIFEIIHNN